MQQEQETIGTRIREARKRLGWYQPELARRMGVTPQSVQSWESDKAVPRQHRLAKLAALLEVDAQWLLQGQSQGDTWDDEDGELGKFSWGERRVVNLMRDLTPDDQIRLIEHAESLRRAARIFRDQRKVTRDGALGGGGKNGASLELVPEPRGDETE